MYAYFIHLRSLSAIINPRCVFFGEEESWGRMGEGRAEGAHIGRVVKSSCVSELKLSCDADDELSRPCVERTDGHHSTEKAEYGFPPGCIPVESFPFIRSAAKQLY